MRRREFMRGMAVVGMAPKLLAQQTQSPAPPPPAPVPWTLGLNPRTPLPKTVVPDAVAEGEPTFFSAEQMATLRRLSALLVPPANGRPGALEVETPAFLDFLIGSSPEERKTLYTGGLDWLNASAQQQFGVPFAQTQPEQADQLVKPWMRAWMTDHPPTEAHAGFLNIAHADIRTATMNSQAWVDSEPKEDGDRSALGLFWSPIEPDIYNEDENRMHVRPSPTTVDAPRSSHTLPSYPN